ncbi:hypothetical protein [Clostridium sp.]|uniref:hypothetical protein n=1 Tax=Clostridium sp. TaxID=1506 RepID=UPI00290AE721|nr:hypothetical protein [Clostridium sp.]MDU4479728.1 hypothetical protein [Clostridium sp.]
MKDNSNLKAKISLEIYINTNNQLLYKINDVADRFDLSLDVIVEQALNRFIEDINFVQNLRK